MRPSAYSVAYSSCIALVLSFAAAPVCRASTLSLRNSAVVLDAGEASYVHHTVEEFRRQIKAITGTAPALHYDLNQVGPNAGTIVVIGRTMADRLAHDPGGLPRITGQEPGPQGFVLKALSPAAGKPVILAAGSDSAGTNYAVMELRQRVLESASGLSVEASLNVRETPVSKVRGLYLHQHWRYNYPYAAWSWTVEDWKRALDIAAYLRVNLVLLWPHMDMLAPPLNAPEQDYLSDVRAIVDYARRKRGIEVWLVEPANILLDAPDAKRVPLENRDYYAWAHSAGVSRAGHAYKPGAAQKNPGDPRDLAALLANREALYRLVPNADGYGYIDMDPGGYPNSPSSEFVDLYVENRKLLNRYHERPREAKLFYWVAGGWGRGTKDENVRETLRAFEQRVPGPWELLFYPAHRKTIQELGYGSRAILFPYNIIEREPSFPLTNLNFEAIRQVDSSGMKGVIANSQSYLLQLPNLFHLLRGSWSREVRSAAEPVLLGSLAKLVYAERHSFLAQGWEQLGRPGSREASAAAEQVREALHGRLGRLGVLGEYLFPASDQVLRDLAVMLRIHARAETVRELAAAGASEKELSQAVAAYLRELLDWQRVNGFFGTYAVNRQVIFDKFNNGPDTRAVSKAWAEFARRRQDRASLEAGITDVLRSAGYTEWIVGSMAGQLFGGYREKTEFDLDVP
ncbi:MAG: hypothetical protein NTY38_21520 [Acidobacteria bacterium]|nr:hypothetical protein [Acidobacteriota bacterium]